MWDREGWNGNVTQIMAHHHLEQYAEQYTLRVGKAPLSRHGQEDGGVRSGKAQGKNGLLNCLPQKGCKRKRTEQSSVCSLYLKLGSGGESSPEPVCGFTPHQKACL